VKWITVVAAGAAFCAGAANTDAAAAPHAARSTFDARMKAGTIKIVHRSPRDAPARRFK
jgi:hypothetical protein